jgi:hypothetical protein
MKKQGHHEKVLIAVHTRNAAPLDGWKNTEVIRIIEPKIK